MANLFFWKSRMAGLKAYKTADVLILSKTCILKSVLFQTEKPNVMEIKSDIVDILKHLTDWLDIEHKTIRDLSTESNNNKQVCILNLAKLQQSIRNLFNKETKDSFEENIVKSHEFINFLFSGCAVQETDVNDMEFKSCNGHCVSHGKRDVPNKEVVRILPPRLNKHPNHTGRILKDSCVDFKMTEEPTDPKSRLERDNNLLKCRHIKKVLFPLFKEFRPTTTQQKHAVFYVTAMKPLRNRMASFKNWSSPVPAAKLARAGFFRNDTQQLTVKCYSCELTFDVKDLNGEEPMAMHSRLSPDCNLVRQSSHRSTDNAGSCGGQLQDRVDSVNADRPTDNVDTCDGHLQNRVDSINANRPTDICEDGSVASQNYSLNGITTDGRSPERFSLGAHGLSRIDGGIDSSHVATSCAIFNESNTNSPISNVANPSEDNNLSYSYAYQPAPQPHSQNSTETRRIRVHTPDQASEANRRNSYRNWPADSFRNTELLILAGFYFTGTEDIVRCFHCDIGLADWNDEEDPWVEHARHSPECPYLIEQKGQHYIDSIQREWAEIYNPKHNHLTEPRSRLNTFANWPQDQVTQTPGQLADAGFFYTGEGDTVRCHYCDGGLREWDPYEDPWTEHARWFPFCKFVIRVKGIQFIRNAAAGNVENDGHQQTANNNIPASFANAEQDVCVPSYEEQCYKKGLKNPLYTTAAQSVLFLDYSKQGVTKAINLYIADTGRRDFKGTDLLKILFKLEETCDKGFLFCYKDKAQPNYTLGTARAMYDDDDDEVEDFELTPEALYKEHEVLTSLFTCIKCKQRERQMLNVPCGHRLTCEICSEHEDYCTQCKAKVTKKVKTYFG